MRSRFLAGLVAAVSMLGIVTAGPSLASAAPDVPGTTTVSNPERDVTAPTTEPVVAPSTRQAPTPAIAANEGLTDAQRSQIASASQGPIASRGGSAGVRGPSQQITPFPARPVPQVPAALRLPANSGTGRRIVYHKSRQRVWLVNGNNAVEKTHLVSGRLTYNQPSPGEYRVFSRSRWTCAINNPAVCWPYMVRFTYGPGGLAIGFHEIPTNRRTGRRLQSLSQLGTARSAGCVRQAPADARYVWNWAPIGTKVVVIQ